MCTAWGLCLSTFGASNGGPSGSCLFCAFESRLGLGVAQMGVCIGVLWLAAAVAPNKGESERYWFLGSSVMCKIGDGPSGSWSCI